jgi:hypothetical protein
LALAALAAGTEYYNTQETAKREDKQAAQSILDQMGIQKKANARTQQTIQQVQGSTAADARAQRLQDYMHTLNQAKARTTAGLTNPVVGGSTFQADSAAAANQAQNYGDQTAALLSRIDAPVVQRQQEGFDYGQLATDLNAIGHQSAGQAFLDRLKQASIRRNAKLDLAASLMSAGAGGVASMGSTGAGMDTSLNTGTDYYGPGSTFAYGEFGGQTGNPLSVSKPYYGRGSTNYLTGRGM